MYARACAPCLPLLVLFPLFLRLWTRAQGPTGDGTVAFKLYALNGRLGLPAGASKEEVLAAMKGKVLRKATLQARVSSD